ncbi:MAG: radical SAM family heme chaperone HemW [Sphaerochaetaceae bacterium]|nr:radical SAM family heme chaperone HemW [Sphaerochaetaceae bacterium]
MDFLSCFDFNRQTSLYIHIPFCKSRCSYCAFYSKAACSREIIADYADKICSEINEITSQTDKPFYTAFIGGGNPGCLSVEELNRICEAVCKNGRPKEFTCEMNPESLTEGHFQLFDKYLTRLSMGIQSLDEKALYFLGRNCTLETELKGINLARELRRKTSAQINFDIICCLPNGHDSLEDVRKICSYRPDHISLYALGIEEGTALYNKGVKPMADDEEALSLKRIWKELEKQGYRHYEVSNFCLEGKESLHNSVYWDYEQYIGLGCSAASTGFRGGKVYRCEDSSQVGEFISKDKLSSYGITEVTEEEQILELIMLSLRHSKGLDLRRLKEDYGRKTAEIPEGFSVKGDFLVPSEDGLLIADAAALSVDSSLLSL